MTTAIFIRPINRDDVPGVVALLADDPVAFDREDPVAIATYVAAFDALAGDPDTRCLGAIDADGAVAGYLQVTLTRHLSYCGARRALLEDLRVRSSCRRRGIGTRLIEAGIAIARAENCQLVQLFMHMNRNAADRLYHKLGFRAGHRGFRLTL